MHLFCTIQVSLDHQRYMEALYDDPGLLIHVRGVTFTPYLMSESRMQDGWLVMERCCQWGRVNWPAPFKSDFPITLLIRSNPETGESNLVLRDTYLPPLYAIKMAPVSHTRGALAISSRASPGPTATSLAARSNERR